MDIKIEVQSHGVSWNAWTGCGLSAWGPTQESALAALRAQIPDRKTILADDFVRSYLETALWSSYDYETGRPLDEDHDVSDCSDELVLSAWVDCGDFRAYAADLLEQHPESMGRNGHNFWLSRNGHGAGFFDTDSPVADALQEAAKTFGTVDLYIDTDGKVEGN